MNETLRAFIALDLPEGTKEILARLVEQQKPLHPEGKWVRREHFHVTLVFFPALLSHQVQDIQSILEELGAIFPSYRTFLGEAGTFPSWQRARVLWIGFDEEGRERTRAIAEACFKRLKAAGIACEEDREFVPHVTLARFKTPKKLERAPFLSWSPIPVTIGEIALFESILKPSGPEYRKLVHVPLKGVRT